MGITVNVNLLTEERNVTNLSVEYDAGQVIFSEGDIGSSAYIIQEGIVIISSEIGGIHTKIATLSKGQFFGELALIDDKPRAGTARSLTPVKLHAIHKDQIQSRISDQDPVSQWLLQNVLGYLRNRIDLDKTRSNDTLESQSAQASNHSPNQDNEDVFSVMKLENELKQALHDGALHLEYQPIITFKDNQCIGFEALIRWHNREAGPISPAVFMPMVEPTQLSVTIGEWQICEICRFLAEVKSATGKRLFTSINITVKQIESGRLLSLMKEQTQKYDILPSQIKFEILERAMFLGEKVNEFFEHCRTVGYSLVIDDFGTGYANFWYLNHYHFDTIKIDKLFIDNIVKEHRDKHICQSMIQLAQGLDITVTAEGIEHPEQAELLKELNCDFGQGYLFSKSMKAQNAIAYLSNASGTSTVTPDE